MFGIAPTATRVCSNTAPLVNERIHQRTLSNVAWYVTHPGQIPIRLGELDQEWDVERAIATGAISLTLIGIAFACLFDVRWVLLSLLVQLFFLQHAFQGWCPPLPLVRRLGFRTELEIQFERNQLEMILSLYGASFHAQNPALDWPRS